ncbi:MAG: hypothetical protein ABIR47_12980 [Candidatus Kapaibacterium sp.]
MFSKHVWYDRQHQAEVFITDEGEISGTIVAYQGAVCVINPRPEILLALYQEAKIKRILSIRSIILTDNSIAFTRGLCAFVNYCRGLRRRTPLTIVTHTDSRISNDFLRSSCARLWSDCAFDLEYAHLTTGEIYGLGRGNIRFTRPPRGNEGSRPYLVMTTDKNRSLHYYDESYDAAVDDSHADEEKPNVVIRAGELPGYLKSVRQRLVVGG